MSLKEIRGRISTVGTIMQITSAMKMVSASKLKKTKNTIYHLDFYIKKMIKIWSIISVNFNIRFKINWNFLKKKPILIIIIGSNKGLCGGFNTNVFRQLLNNYSKYSSHLLIVGKKIKNLLINRFFIYKDHSYLFNDICFNNVEKTCDMFIYDFLKGNFHSVHLIYNRLKPKSSIQELINEIILPIKKLSCTDNKIENSYFLYEPSKLIYEIIIHNIKIHLFKAILASFVAEQASRMKAMHQSTDNASKLKNSLLLFYNKARQTAITKEILEITSGG